MPVRPPYNKSASAYRRPEGMYKAEVTRVVGTDVYVKVPRLSYEFEHGPIPYAGATPIVGQETYVGLLEGRQDDVVAIFPSAAGGSSGPIESTFFICSDSQRQELQDVADYVVPDDTPDGTIHDVVQQNPGARVVLSPGNFRFIKPTGHGNSHASVDMYPGQSIVGSGGQTVLYPYVDNLGWQYTIYANSGGG